MCKNVAKCFYIAVSYNAKSSPYKPSRGKFLQRGEAAHHKQSQEHDQKAALSSSTRKKVNKPGISKNLATCRIRICDLLQSNDFESHALSLESLKLKNQQTLVTNKAATYANKLKLKMISNLSIINIHQRKEIIMNAS